MMVVGLVSEHTWVGDSRAIHLSMHGVAIL